MEYKTEKKQSEEFDLKKKNLQKKCSECHLQSPNFQCLSKIKNILVV